MKLKGTVNITIVDSQNNTTNQIIQDNLIPDNSWLQLLGSNSVKNFFGGKRISISQDTRTPIANVFIINNIIATAYAPSGITTPFWNEMVEPIYGQITGRIDPTGTARQFNSVALTGLGSGGTQNTSTIAYAWLLLDIPCTQLENDFINITYSIQFIDDIGESFVNKNTVRYDFGRTMFNIANFTMSNFYTHLFNTIQNLAIRLPVGDKLIGYIDQFGGTPYSLLTRVDSHFKWKYKLTTDRNSNLGIIYNTLTQGLSSDSKECYSVSKFNYDKEPFQTGFFHGQNSSTPFFDAANPANGQGLIYLSGNWQSKFPEMYKINITKSGDAATAEYKFLVLKHLGFSGNTLNIPDSITPYRNFNYPFATKLHGWREVDFDIHRYSNTQIVQYDDTGVSLVDLFDGINQTWDTTTTPALPCTTIRQIAVDTTNKKIYVGCRSTGLWMINPVANTITNIFAVECYGVDVGRNNVVFAIVNNGFYTSNDWSTQVNLTFAGLSDNNWSRTKYLKADPEHTNDRVCIVADNGSGTTRIIWYEFSVNIATLGYQNEEIPIYCGGLDVSDIGSTWAFVKVADNSNLCSFLKPIFNSTTVNSLGTFYARPLLISKFYTTSLLYSKICFYKDSVFGATSFVGGTFNYDYVDLPLSFDKAVLNNYVLHLTDGIVLINNFLRQIFSNNALAYTNYGWDGSQWVKDNPNSKLCHATDQTLINGLSIRFQNGVSTPHFVINEYFTQGVNYGLLKDNATDLEITTQWYSKSIYYADVNITIPSAAQITLSAASETYFRIIETDDTSLHAFKIANIPVTKIYTDLVTAPLISEIRLQSNGVVVFNNADVGKSFTGKYLWISS